MNSFQKIIKDPTFFNVFELKRVSKDTFFSNYKFYVLGGVLLCILSFLIYRFTSNNKKATTNSITAEGDNTENERFKSNLN